MNLVILQTKMTRYELFTIIIEKIFLLNFISCKSINLHSKFSLLCNNLNDY